MMDRAEKNHDKMLDDIIKSSYKVGLRKKDLRMIMKEPMLLNNNQIIAAPDILFVDRNLNNYIIEYKASYNDKAYKQLQNAYDHLVTTNIGGNFYKIFAYGGKYNLKYEHVR